MYLAWHFVCADKQGKPILRDGRRVPAVGETLKHDTYVRLCLSGLHASINLRDAFEHRRNLISAPKFLCLVRCDDIVSAEADKFVCRRRTVIAIIQYNIKIRDILNVDKDIRQTKLSLVNKRTPNHDEICVRADRPSSLCVRCVYSSAVDNYFCCERDNYHYEAESFILGLMGVDKLEQF